MSKISKIVAGLAVVPVLAISGTALAGSPGQLAGGDNYQVKNLTQKGSYANTISATCNDEIEYSMELSNVQFGSLKNVTLKATLPSDGGASTATATTDLGGNSGTSDSVTVNLGSNQTQTLESGTTVLYDHSGNALKTLPDTITSGVNIGTLEGSTTEFVNFKAKVNCPTPPKPPVTPPSTPQTPAGTTPTALVNTGPGSAIAAFVAATIAGALGYRRFVSRRLSRQ
ncbi:MAG TPA: hypothetical protein VFH99_01755 [Candidatus Saccharimonadales bacterium]|nr:hypothetical protein [Candidatus Saccharimonadales bacterium]